MHDDHFKLPIGKADQLRPPEDFPPAVYRYTLREMSLVWHMYGGRDFTSSPHSRSGVYSAAQLYFCHLKLELLTQFPASNDKKYANSINH